MGNIGLLATHNVGSRLQLPAHRMILNSYPHMLRVIDDHYPHALWVISSPEALLTSMPMHLSQTDLE